MKPSLGLARSKTLAVGERRQTSVLEATHSFQVVHQLPIKHLTTLGERGMVALGLGQQVGRLGSIAPPVRPEAMMKELDGIEVIVSEDEVPADGLCADPAKVKGESRDW